MVTFDWEECDAKKKVKLFNKKKSIVWAVFELTNRCNFNCVWCYANSGPKSQHISIEKAKRIIQMLADVGVIQVTFSGGEPLLYPHLKEIIKIAKDCEMVIHMNTNGYFLTKKLAKKLYDLGLTQVQINIDSLNPRKHDQIRGKIGSFNRAVRALKIAKTVGLTCASQTVLTKQNENEIIDIFRFTRSIGVQRCRVWDMVPTGHAEGKMDIIPTDYICTLKKLTEFAYKTEAKNIESGDPLFPLDYKTGINVTGGYCAALTGALINISYRGDVYFCVTDRNPMFNVFNIESDLSLEKIYKSELEKYVHLLKISQKCYQNKCGFLDRCKSGCPTRCRYDRFGNDYNCPYLR